jgi:two-component system sensor histidine kinase MprB
LTVAQAGEAAWTLSFAALLDLAHPCNILRANPAAVRLAGMKSGDLVGRCFCRTFGIVGAPERCALIRVMRGTERRVLPRWLPIETGIGRSSVLYSAVTQGGTTELGDRPGAVVTMIPSAAVDHADRKRRELLAAALHDLRHPATIQMLSLDVLLSEELLTLSPTAATILRRLQRATDSLVRDIEHLHQRSLYDLGVGTPSPQRVSLRAQIMETVFQVEPVLRRRQQTVDVRVPAGLTVWADPRAVEHILLNLLVNAHAYAPAGDRFQVAARSLSGLGMAEMVVRDHGPGISAGERRRVFEQFYRGSSATTHRGAGLGLAIVQSLAEQQGGMAGVRRTAGGGATFWVRLPLSPSPDPTSAS